ncbi:hypothetical protein MLD38_003979 [Melastoma candidum]|uniref:Uncharacterized protein n=1 Tax=Melastoma candidum TaxID=119954 RepID=A0ACB9S5T5_9MYRT|nr:hypothetical protein MLD38_003979 [Melastoma candidum]
MASFNGLALGLSVVFGCLMLAFVAEVYYLFWWKKRGLNSNSIPSGVGDVQEVYSKYAKEMLHLIFWKKSSSLQEDSRDGNCGDVRVNAGGMGEVSDGEGDPEIGNHGKELLLKPLGEESIESELMRLQGLAGPPRLLFTIKEETKEDLESDDGRSRGDRSRKGSRTRSLSDVVLAIDTPFLTPLASPSRGFSFNPLFDSSVEMELGRMRSSPPPKFQFLRDAEEKLLRKLQEEAMRKASELSEGVVDHSGDKDGGQLLAIIVGRDGAYEVIRSLPQFPSSSSQVLPLASSPSATTFRPLDKKLTVH